MKYFLVVLMLSTSAAFAHQETMFEKTKAMFEQGRLPTAAELTGWRVGRCYYSSYNDPNVAYAGIAFGMTHVTGAPAGELHVMISPPRDYALPADQFDDPTPEALQQMQDVIVDPYYGYLTKAEAKDGYMHSSLANADYRFRVYTDAANPTQAVLVSEGVALSSGVVRLACHHEKKIHE